MSSIRGVGGGGPPPTMRRALLSNEGRKALAVFSKDAVSEVGHKFYDSHRDTEDLRWMAERYRRRKQGKASSSVMFEMEPETGKIRVAIEDELSGELVLRLSPEQLEEALQKLEVTGDNDASLSSFFIDIKI
jgi:hypothetical protein